MNLTKRDKQKIIFILSVLVPVIGLFVIVRIRPIIEVLRLSFFKYSLLTQSGTFVGIRQFTTLFSDPDFVRSLTNTLVFAAVSVPGNVLLGLSIAMLLESRRRRHPTLEAIYFMPYMIPLVPVSLIWKWIYNPDGLLNGLLGAVGLPSVAWLSSDMALYSIVILFVWRMNGYLMIIFLVGLRAIPKMYHEAAEIDGANWWQKTRHVTLPLLRPVLLYGTVMATVWAFMIFSPVYVMTQGSDFAPGGSVTVLSLDLYNRAFTYLHLGRACAEAAILFSIIIFFTIFQLRLGGSTKSVY